MKRSALWLVVAVAGFCSIADHPAEDIRKGLGSSTLLPGEPAPRFSLLSVEGTRIDLEEELQASSGILVKFWATWCPACWIDLLQLNDTYQQLQSQGLEVLAVAVDKAEDVAVFLESQSVPCPVLLDEDGEVAKRFGVVALPTTVFIDGKGRIVKTHPGLVSDLQSYLASLPPPEPATVNRPR